MLIAIPTNNFALSDPEGKNSRSLNRGDLTDCLLGALFQVKRPRIKYLGDDS